VEKARARLAYTEDFNLMDAFRLFDFVGRGNVSEGELKEGLKILGVNT
jgi:Ca2+-binding EF-hand superfamily protein